MLIHRRGLLRATGALALACLYPSAGSAAAPKPLRVIWLNGNPVMARVGPDGIARGPAIDVAQAIAKRLGRPLEVAAVTGTDALLTRLRTGGADLAFVAYDPSRASGLRFTPPYLLSTNVFAVPSASAITDMSQVDRAGIRIASVPTDSGGLFLRRTIRNASIVPIPSIDAGLDQLKVNGFDVLGGAAQRLMDRQAEGGFRILRGSFYEVPQCVAVRADDPAMLAAATAAIADARKSGVLAAAIARARLGGASVPPADAAAPN